MRVKRLVVVGLGLVAMATAGAAGAATIPPEGCWCFEEDSLRCFNMRRDVTNWWGELGADHTFTMCQDRYGNSSVWEDNWASRDYSQNNLGAAWSVEDLGCIKIDSLFAAKAQTDNAFADACPGYEACAAQNDGWACQGSYWLPDACFCYPWQLVFRSHLETGHVVSCPAQGGGGGGGGSSDPSDYDYGPYFPDDWPQYEDDGTSLWRVCVDYCTATGGSAVYSNGQYIGGSVSCIAWETECWLEWHYN